MSADRVAAGMAFALQEQVCVTDAADPNVRPTFDVGSTDTPLPSPGRARWRRWQRDTRFEESAAAVATRHMSCQRMPELPTDARVANRRDSRHGCQRKTCCRVAIGCWMLSVSAG
jgi:hypothetical protein